jgi:hypothetical protein
LTDFSLSTVFSRVPSGDSSRPSPCYHRRDRDARSPAHRPIIKTYIKDLQHLKSQQISHELGLKSPFQNLLDRAAKKRGWTLVPELSTYSGGRRVVPDGTVRDEYRLARGWWEAKDTSDNLAAEIQKKLRAGYPTRNTIFEDTQTAVLYQDRSEAGEFHLDQPLTIADLLNRFFSHDESDEREFERAMSEFKSRIPDLARSLREHIADAHKSNRRFKSTFADFVALCRASLNPDLSEKQVDEMLIQHLLTERLMRNLFQNPEFAQRNVIAAQVENVINGLASSSFSRSHSVATLRPLDLARLSRPRLRPAGTEARQPGAGYNRTMPKSTAKRAAKKNGAGPKKEVSDMGRILRKLAEENVASGAKLLSRREVRQEVLSRRNG